MPETGSGRGSAEDDPLLGTHVDGRYDVRRLVGTGGMGRVYLAHQTSAGRDVALKVLAEYISSDESAVSRFQTEAEIVAQLRHPNTIQLYDMGRLSDGRLYLVTEYLTGTPLDRRLKAGPMSSRQAVAILLQICDSLAEAHAKGIVHRDLKPGNLILEPVGDAEVVKVLDFGIAKLADRTGLTLPGVVFGTPAYMSPEQAMGAPIDHRSDIYSLGVIFYHCLAGRPPFPPQNPQAVLYQHVNEPPPAFGDLSRPVVVAPALESLVMEMLAKDRADRPADMREVRRRLLAYERGGHRDGGSGPRPVVEPATTHYMAGPPTTTNSEVTLGGRWSTRSRFLLVALLGVTVVLGLALGIMLPRWWGSAAVDGVAPDDARTSEPAAARAGSTEMPARPAEPTPEDSSAAVPARSPDASGTSEVEAAEAATKEAETEDRGERRAASAEPAAKRPLVALGPRTSGRGGRRPPTLRSGFRSGSRTSSCRPPDRADASS